MTTTAIPQNQVYIGDHGTRFSVATVVTPVKMAAELLVVAFQANAADKSAMAQLTEVIPESSKDDQNPTQISLTEKQLEVIQERLIEASLKKRVQHEKFLTVNVCLYGRH